MSGGSVEDYFWAVGSSSITIVGSNFMVDTGSGPVPVPYGDLTALTGTLASSGTLNNLFYQGGHGGWATGTIYSRSRTDNRPAPRLRPHGPRTAEAALGVGCNRSRTVLLRSCSRAQGLLPEFSRPGRSLSTPRPS